MSAETLLRGFLSGELYRRGLICRADDRGDPVIQLSPPLIAGPEQFEEIEADPAAGAARGGGADASGRPAPPQRLRRRQAGSTDADGPRAARGPRRPPAGRRGGLDLPVRWVHISELLDPTPWLSGGELLLSTGMQLEDRAQRGSSTAWPITSSRGSGSARGSGTRCPAVARGRRRARVPGVRGALRAAVHRDHRGGVHAARQRAVRGPAPRARRAGAARADRPVRAGARCARGVARDARRRRSARVRRPRRAARSRTRSGGRSSPTSSRRCEEVRDRAAGGCARVRAARRDGNRGLALPVAADGARRDVRRAAGCRRRGSSRSRTGGRCPTSIV